MLLYPFPALLTSFPRTFIIQGNANNGRNLLSPFPVIAFINEEATGVFNEAAIGAIIAQRNPPSCFLNFVCVLLFQSHHQSTDQLIDFKNIIHILI